MSRQLVEIYHPKTKATSTVDARSVDIWKRSGWTTDVPKDAHDGTTNVLGDGATVAGTDLPGEDASVNDLREFAKAHDVDLAGARDKAGIRAAIDTWAAELPTAKAAPVDGDDTFVPPSETQEPSAPATATS
jgi:hypothetical protein